MFRRIILMVTTVLMISCQEGNQDPSSPPIKSPKHLPEPHTGLTVMRVVIAGDNMELQTGGVGDRMKYFRQKYSNQLKNHVIVAPGNEGQLKIDTQDAVVHSKAETEIGTTMVDLANTHNPERMVVFLATHGQAGNGNLCYKSQQSCTFTAQNIVDAINALDAANNLKASDKQLKHLVIVPIACYNQTLAQSIFDTLHKGSHKSFSVNMTHMVHYGPEKCFGGFGGMSVGESLFTGQMLFYEYELMPETFNAWIKDNNRLNKFLTMQNLEDSVTVINDLMNHNFTKIQQQGTLKRFAPPHLLTPLALTQFELKQTLIFSTMHSPYGGYAPPNQTVVNNQYTASPKDIASGFIGLPKLEALVSSVIDNKGGTYKQGSPEFTTKKIWDNDTSFKILMNLH